MWKKRIDRQCALGIVYSLFAFGDSDTIQYAISGAVRIKKGDRVLHEQYGAEHGLNFDGSPDQLGVGKVRYWEEEVDARY